MSKEKLSQDKARRLTPTVKKTMMERIVFPVNNQRKKITLLFVLFFAFLAQKDLSDIFLYIPDFNELALSEGRIKIHKGQGKVLDDFMLVDNNQKTHFSCRSIDCLPINKTSDYQGKTAKVWWYKAKNFGLMGEENLLYQLEINETIVISYQEQIKKYSSMKDYCLCMYLVFFIISVMFFLLLQFANDPITSKRNEK